MPIRLAKGHSPETRTLTEEEEVLLLLPVPDRETAWCFSNLVLLHCSACEGSAADVGDLDLREGWLTVHGKGNRLRRLPVPNAVLPELRRRAAGGGEDEPFLLDTRGRRMSPHQSPKTSRAGWPRRGWARERRPTSGGTPARSTCWRT